jgi:hypothetical protein
MLLKNNKCKKKLHNLVISKSGNTTRNNSKCKFILIKKKDKIFNYNRK